MEDKNRALNIIVRYLKESDLIIESVMDFERLDPNLPELIKGYWTDQNDFFNDLSEFLLRDNS